MFAEFFLTEAQARARLDAWAAGIRGDWSVGPVIEARRARIARPRTGALAAWRPRRGPR